MGGKIWRLKSEKTMNRKKVKGGGAKTAKVYVGHGERRKTRRRAAGNDLPWFSSPPSFCGGSIKPQCLILGMLAAKVPLARRHITSGSQLRPESDKPAAPAPDPAVGKGAPILPLPPGPASIRPVLLVAEKTTSSMRCSRRRAKVPAFSLPARQKNIFEGEIGNRFARESVAADPPGLPPKPRFGGPPENAQAKAEGRGRRKKVQDERCCGFFKEVAKDGFSHRSRATIGGGIVSRGGLRFRFFTGFFKKKKKLSGDGRSRWIFLRDLSAPVGRSPRANTSIL